MPRRPYKKREAASDPAFNSYEVAKLVSYIMLDGKKSIAENIVYSVLDEIKKEGKDPLDILHQAINNASPRFEVKPKRLGGASYLVPTEVRKERALFLGLNWIVNAASARPNKEYRSFAKKLLAEIRDAIQNQGQAVSKRLQTEKLAEANKAFSHLKW